MSAGPLTANWHIFMVSVGNKTIKRKAGSVSNSPKNAVSKVKTVSKVIFLSRTYSAQIWTRSFCAYMYICKKKKYGKLGLQTAHAQLQKVVCPQIVNPK